MIYSKPSIQYFFFFYIIVGSIISRVDHHWKIRARKQRTDIGKYSFVNRSITDWNQLPEGAIGTSNGKTHIFKTRVRKVKISVGK
jgi:hypothetical protein